MKIVISGVSSSQERAMLIAVADLSPVNTHTLIPARSNAWIVEGTPTCIREEEERRRREEEETKKRRKGEEEENKNRREEEEKRRRRREA